jgi:hypothetical protein
MPFLESFLFDQKVTVRLKPKYAEDTRELIRMLAADDRDGRTRRASIYEWLDCERPILEMFHGFYHRLRVEGPATRVSPEVIFPLGSTLYSRGVCARLDPIQTKRLEERLRSAMDAEFSRWIDEHHLRQDEPCIEIALDRPAADLVAEEKIDAWLAGRSPDQPVDWTKSDD